MKRALLFAVPLAGALLLLFLARRSLRRRQALLGSAEARWMPTLTAPESLNSKT